MKPPACYYPAGVPQPVRTIPYANVAGWHASGPVARLKGPPWPQPAPEKAESACDLIAWYAAYPEASCSFRTALVLSRLHAEYGRTGAATRRSAGPTATGADA